MGTIEGTSDLSGTEPIQASSSGHIAPTGASGRTHVIASKLAFLPASRLGLRCWQPMLSRLRRVMPRGGSTRSTGRRRRRPKVRASTFERLEQRALLSALPFGAQPGDTGEFLLGDVDVSVVLMESDGSIDPNLEDWTSEQIENTKAVISEGLAWWEDTLALQGSVHSLNFILDFTYANAPVSTGYEPISRHSNDYLLWAEDFLSEAGFNSPASLSEDIRAFNHAQRSAQGADWAFTIFVVNAADDPNGRFESGGDFSLAFAFSGGRFFVMPSGRPASTVAHETGHIFWALDEYAGTRSYFEHRGYYNTQNLNAVDNTLEPETRVDSLMASASLRQHAFLNHTSSPTSLEMVGWKDSDGNGIFDVLDVPHALTGSGVYDNQTRIYRFVGSSSVQTLPNLNSSGLGSDITLNRISRAEYRLDSGAWQTAALYDAYTADLDLSIGPLSEGMGEIEIRTIDDRSGVTSDVFLGNLGRPSATPFPGINGLVWYDVNADGLWSPGETSLDGWTIRVLDENQQAVAATMGIEPDDFSHGTIVSSAIDRVTLTAVGVEVADDAVGGRETEIVRASTGTHVLGHLTHAGWRTAWTDSGRRLRLQFSSPVTTVSIDAVGTGVGRLEIYDAGDNLLGRYTTRQLAEGQFETMTLSRPVAKIAYAIAGGHAGTTVQLDNFRFGPEAATVTDFAGAYSIPLLEPGNYTVQAVAPEGWVTTAPMSATRQVVLGSGEIVDRIDFGGRPAALLWQNAVNRFDVNNDGHVSPIDVLLIINDVNNKGARRLPVPPAPADIWPRFLDVTGDGFVSPIDILHVINTLNARTSAGAEAEALDANPIFTVRPPRHTGRAEMPDPAVDFTVFASAAAPTHPLARPLDAGAVDIVLDRLHAASRINRRAPVDHDADAAAPPLRLRGEVLSGHHASERRSALVIMPNSTGRADKDDPLGIRTTTINQQVHHDLDVESLDLLAAATARRPSS